MREAVSGSGREKGAGACRNDILMGASTCRDVLVKGIGGRKRAGIRPRPQRGRVFSRGKRTERGWGGGSEKGDIKKRGTDQSA